PDAVPAGTPARVRRPGAGREVGAVQRGEAEAVAQQGHLNSPPKGAWRRTMRRRRTRRAHGEGSLRQRGGWWIGRVPSPQGRREVRLHTKDREEAIRKLRSLLDEVQRPDYQGPARRATLQDATNLL